MKVLYKSFRERELPRIKTNYPGLKKSQYEERLHKAWIKSPENPFSNR